MVEQNPSPKKAFSAVIFHCQSMLGLLIQT